MDTNNILSGDINTLREFRSLVENYNNSKALNEQAEAEEKRLNKELAINKKNLKDDIEITIKKRRNEVAAQFDKEIDKDEDKLKKIRSQRSKAKDKGIKERIAEETADLTSQNGELKSNIKTALKDEKLPKFCGYGFYFALYFTKGAGEILLCALMIILMFLILPAAVYVLLPFEKLPEQYNIFLLALTFFVVIVLVFFIYKIIGDQTKHKHKETLISIRSLRDQINSNKNQIRKIAHSIRKDKNEDMYNLESYDSKIKEIENDISIITQNKADAIKVFDETTSAAITQEIESREMPRIRELEQSYSEMAARHAELEDTVKQMGIKLSTEYESYLDKTFSDTDKIDELISIMETGSAATIGDAIQVYKNKE
ncbi:MAG: hypothetical protein ACI4EN_01005 [Butyrivibrio sp.]